MRLKYALKMTLKLIQIYRMQVINLQRNRKSKRSSSFKEKKKKLVE